MYILGLDTSTKCLSVAICENDKKLFSFHKDVGVNHSSLLVPTIEKMLNKAKLSLKNVDVVCVSIGPGSFTGLRIAVAAIKAFYFVFRMKIVSIPTMDVIAENYADVKTDLGVILDARKSRVYAAVYKKQIDGWSRKSDYMLIEIDKILPVIKKPITFVGDGVKIYKENIKRSGNKNICILEDDKWYPNALKLTKIALNKIKNSDYTSAESLEPMYLYPKECNVRGFKF